MAPLIYFRCREAAHQLGVAAPTTDRPGSPITWHDGNWAYCPLGASGGHVWEPVAPPLSRTELLLGAKSEMRV